MATSATLWTFSSNNDPNTSDSTNFEARFTPPINVNNLEIALASASFSNNIVNISAAMGNNAIGYYDGTSNHSMTITDGMYAVSQINAVLSDFILTNGGTPANISLGVDAATGRLRLVLLNSYQLIINSGTLYKNLGYSAPQIITTAGVSYSDALLDLVPIQALLLHCSAVSTSIMNGTSSDLIGVYDVVDAPGTLVVFKPQIINFSAFNTDVLSSMIMRITNDDNGPISLGNQEVRFSFLVRKKAQN